MLLPNPELRSTDPDAPETLPGPEDRPSLADLLHRGILDSARVPEDIDLVRDRSIRWYEALKPRNEFHGWLVDQVAVLTIRVDRVGRIERRLRDRHSLRAELFWDSDRRREAEDLGARLARDPSRVVESLRATPQGCDWLMARWSLLARAAEGGRPWTPAQAALAFDLLGTPAEFRDGAPADLGPDRDPAALALRQVACLVEHREAAARLDEVDRSLARADLSDEENRELKRLRRYESTLHGRIRWCFAQLRQQAPDPAPDYRLRPRWVERPDQPEATPAPSPAPAPEPEPPSLSCPHPPFDLEPDEDPGPGRVADIPAILESRRARREKLAEGRRVARRRTLERLRA